ncbi:MAG: hypothetical protein COV70_01795 [Parcubacteria group bacterium CG11_big_fil_rev_8_21_14_0_20_39_22]|nr:MAG: hypothetical protein COV70_01795 [Parcubacteria group bacterium CG11_big_fil_rev_8_21_14_0_20_39_22]
MTQKNKNIIGWIIGILVVVLIVVGIIWAASRPGKLDAFASCLEEKKAVFYGAFWCPHCQNQKAMFGSSQRKLPYIECSTPDGKGQLQICEDKQIDTYPTWIFEDGSRLSGEISLERLSEVTGCELPQNN